MRRLWIAIRVFFAVLCSAAVAREVERLLAGAGPTEPVKPAELQKGPKPEAKKPRRAVRSEAVTLLATLQREARFVDFIKEPLAGYSDAQIGAAARDVHRECGRVLERLFAIRAIAEQQEGSEMEVPPGFDAGRWRLTGNVAGDPPFRGRLRHHGWEATQCEVPSWSGSEAAAMTIAPIEVELQ